VLTGFYPETGRWEEMVLYKNQNEILFHLVPGVESKNWVISTFSPTKSLENLGQNSYWNNFVKQDGGLVTNFQGTVLKRLAEQPENPKQIFWLAESSPLSPLPLRGFALTGNQFSLELSFYENHSFPFLSRYNPNGGREYFLKQGF